MAGNAHKRRAKHNPKHDRDKCVYCKLGRPKFARKTNPNFKNSVGHRPHKG